MGCVFPGAPFTFTSPRRSDPHASFLWPIVSFLAHFRIPPQDPDSVLAGVHAWLYKQERVLLIFDNCNMDRSDEAGEQRKDAAPGCVVPSRIHALMELFEGPWHCLTPMAFSRLLFLLVRVWFG